MRYTKIVIDSNDHRDIQLLRYINGYNSSTWHNWWLKCKVIDLQFASFSKMTAYKSPWFYIKPNSSGQEFNFNKCFVKNLT